MACIITLTDAGLSVADCQSVGDAVIAGNQRMREDSDRIIMRRIRGKGMSMSSRKKGAY
jgi:hypothetical protein